MSSMKVKFHEAVGLDHWEGLSMFDVVVFERNEEFLRERARADRARLVEDGTIGEVGTITRELLREGMSFSMQEEFFSVGVYARTPPGKVTP